VNIHEVAIEMGVGTKNFTNSTQQVVANGNLFPLPHLLAKKTQGKELLVDYSQNHVVISKNI
jgi:hypothetical protein